jgi:hypothetical protein
LFLGDCWKPAFLGLLGVFPHLEYEETEKNPLISSVAMEVEPLDVLATLEREEKKLYGFLQSMLLIT